MVQATVERIVVIGGVALEAQLAEGIQQGKGRLGVQTGKFDARQFQRRLIEGDGFVAPGEQIEQ